MFRFVAMEKGYGYGERVWSKRNQKNSFLTYIGAMVRFWTPSNHLKKCIDFLMISWVQEKKLFQCGSNLFSLVLQL